MNINQLNRVIWLVMAFKARALHWGGKWLCPLGSAPLLKLGPPFVCFLFSGLPGATSPARASREQAPLRSRQAPRQPHSSNQVIARWVLHRQTSGTALQPSAEHQRIQLGTWHAPSAPMPSGWPSPLAGRPGSVCTQA